MKNINEAIYYSNIYMIPNKKCTVASRSECNTSVVLGNRTFVSPVYPANMRSVVNKETCKFFAENGWFYTMHRFGDTIDNFTRYCLDNKIFCSVSVGVKEDSYNQLEEAKGYWGESIDYITIDIANAWSDSAKKMADFIKTEFPKSFLICGNVGHHDAIEDIELWGTVDAIKVGIGNGMACTTKNKTGFFLPMASCVADCAGYAKIPIIADGGIREIGDISKAIALGAHMVMAGGIFAGYDQSSGDICEKEGKYYKEYYGSASQFNKTHHTHIEGTKHLMQYNGDIKPLMQDVIESLQSSISYAGGKTLEDLRNHRDFVVIK